MSQVPQALVGTLRHVDIVDTRMAGAFFERQYCSAQFWKVVLRSETRGDMDTYYCTDIESFNVTFSYI